MKSETNDPQAAHWTDDPAQQEKFFTEVRSRIKSQSKSAGHRYGVEDDWEDIASEVEIELWQQMPKGNSDGPFAEDSPEKAVGALSENGNFKIRNRAKSLARKIAKKRSRQDEIREVNGRSIQAKTLADVRYRDMPPEIETSLVEAAKNLQSILSKIDGFTPRDNEIARKELLRQAGIDDLPAPMFDQVAEAAGVSASEQRAYNAYHEEHERNSDSDRQAWSRARRKVKKAFTKAMFVSLLMFVFALSLALCNAIHQGRSIHQIAHQDRSIQNDLAHQDG
ncbi:MAG TPA: hypothetical protein VKB86_06470 [Pyrinomonadaceae bacterium]|nr:hypothetical protein [Pyrinomonadaceae bacterium]